MRHAFAPVSGAVALALGVAMVLIPNGLHAQTTGGSIFDRDFMFGKPRATLSFNMGYGVARAGSDIFQEMDTILTLGKRDFDSPVVGGSLALYLNDRIDLSFQVGFSRSETWSEYVEYVEDLGDGREAPIEQKTRFTRVPMTASILYYPVDRGRQLSRFAWVPTRWSPYVGLGGGRVYYSFQQNGDFLDFEDFSIFTGDFRSSGYAWSGHALAGAQFALSAQVILSAEGRYSWADAELDRANFRDFKPIDLSGFQLTAGIGVRF
jgi:hypothetical protein